MDGDNVTQEPACPGHDGILNLQSASEEKISSYLYSDTERHIILALYPVALIIGITGNLAFLLVLACLPKMRTITNFYLGNLAIADVTFLCCLGYDVLVGFLLSPYVKTKPYWSSLGCGLLVIVKYTSHIASVGIIFLVTMERYYGICKPLQHRRIVAKGRTLKLVMTAWLVGLIFAAMVVPKYSSFKSKCIIWPQTPEYEHLPTTMKSCTPIIPFFNIFQSIVLALPLATVLTINMLMYFMIVRELSSRVSAKSKTTQSVTEVTANKRALGVRSQVTRLLVATGLFFFFCCVPEFVLRLNGVALTLSASEVGFKMTPRQKWIVVWMARGLTTTNAVVNPIIYSLTNVQYRQAFRKVLLCNIDETVLTKTTNGKTSSSSEKARNSSIARSNTDTRM